jgi:hypothetical protein
MELMDSPNEDRDQGKRVERGHVPNVLTANAAQSHPNCRPSEVKMR